MRRVRSLAPEPPDLGLLENVVPAEHFVGAFAGEHDLVAAVAHELREQEQRRRRRPEDRLLGVPDHIGEDTRDVLGRAPNRLMLGLRATG